MKTWAGCTPDADLRTKSKELLSTSKAQVFVLTQGADGAIFFTKDSQVTVPAVKVDNLADTVGAGDTFMSALIYQLQGQQAAPSDTELARVEPLPPRHLQLIARERDVIHRRWLKWHRDQSSHHRKRR